MTDKPDQENFDQLSGLYSAKPDSSWKPTLADFLIVNYSLDHLTYNLDDTLEVELETLNQEQIKTKIYRNQTLEFEKVLEGQLKNNYFVLNRQGHLETDLYGILRTPTRQQTRIGYRDGDLIIDSEEAWFPSFLILPFMYVKYDYYDEKFKKIKTAGNKK